MKRILKGSGGNKINLKVRKLLQFKIFLKAINTHGGGHVESKKQGGFFMPFQVLLV